MGAKEGTARSKQKHHTVGHNQKFIQSDNAIQGDLRFSKTLLNKPIVALGLITTAPCGVRSCVLRI